MSLQLKEARIQAGYSVDAIAKELNIRKQYLYAIEEENYSILPGQVYTDGYRKLYAKYLGVSLINKQTLNEEQKLFHSRIVKNKKVRKYLVAISIIMLILIVTIYRLVLQLGASVDQISITDNSNYNNDAILH